MTKHRRETRIINLTEEELVKLLDAPQDCRILETKKIGYAGDCFQFTLERELQP